MSPDALHACHRKLPLRLHACTKMNKTRQLINTDLITGNRYCWRCDQEWGMHTEKQAFV